MLIDKAVTINGREYLAQGPVVEELQRLASYADQLAHVVRMAAEWDADNTDCTDLAALGAYARAALAKAEGAKINGAGSQDAVPAGCNKESRHTSPAESRPTLSSPEIGVSVPEGWKLVPVEPTGAMLEAVKPWPKHWTDDYLGDNKDRAQAAYMCDQAVARQTYCGMLAAAPQPPQSPGQVPLSWQEVSDPPKDGAYLSRREREVFRWSADRHNSRCYVFRLPPLPGEAPAPINSEPTP